MSESGLTARQHALLLFIQRHIDARGHSPSFAEMGAALGSRSKSGITKAIEQLLERGYIARIPERWRSITVVRRIPDDAGATEAYRAALKLIADGKTRRPRMLARKALERYP